MNSKIRIIEGGGWTQRQYQGKPKARFLTFLAGAWLIVAVIGSLPLWSHSQEPAFEWSWLYSLAVIPEPILITLAIVSWITEERRLVTEWHRTGHDFGQSFWC